MGSATPRCDAANLEKALSAFATRGAAYFEPQFGSTFRHIGPDALDLLHRLTTNSLLDLADGSARRTILTNEKGRIIDVLWVLKRSQNELLLVSDAPNATEMMQGIERFTIIEDAELIDESDRLKRWYVFGPNASQVLGEVLPELDCSSSEVGSIRGMDGTKGGTVLALRTDAAGATSWLVIAELAAAGEVVSRFYRAGLSPAPDELFSHVRIANREPIAGNELTTEVNPLEAGLMHLIDFDKGCYVGQEVIARLDTYDKVQRSLVGITQKVDASYQGQMTAGERIHSDDSVRNVGWITSIGGDWRNGETIGLAYLRKAYGDVDRALTTKEGATIRVLTGTHQTA